MSDFAYSWPDAEILADGGTTPIIGVTGIEYTVSRDHQNLMGKGKDPVEMIKGMKSYGGSMGFLQSAINALEDVLQPDQDITDVVYNFNFGLVPSSGPSRVDRIIGVRFLEVPKAMSTEDVAMKPNCPFIAFKIKPNV